MAAAPAGSFDDIETARLVLRLLPTDAVAAGLAGDLARCADLLGAHVPVDLREEPTVLVHTKGWLDEDPLYQPWSMRALIGQADPGDGRPYPFPHAARPGLPAPLRHPGRGLRFKRR